MIPDSPFLSHLYIYTERSYTGTSGTRPRQSDWRLRLQDDGNDHSAVQSRRDERHIGAIEEGAKGSCLLHAPRFPSALALPFLLLPLCISLCTTFRHRHFRLSSLIEIAEVEEGNAEVGERKKKRVKRRSGPSDARAAQVADCFWFLCLFALQGNNVFPALARVRGKRLRKRADEAGKQAIRLLHPKETAVGLSWTYEQKNAAGQPTLLAGYTSDSRRGPSPARPDL